MTVLNALILGIVQGLTEFLPVSSSGHLVLLQKMFGISETAGAEASLLFDTLLHGGTLLAVFAALRKDILALLKRPVQPLTLYLLIGTAPAVGAALLFRGPIEEAFASGAFLGGAFLLTAALLFTAECFSGRVRFRGAAAQNPPREADRPPARAMRWYDALIVGALQAAAVLPGVSRSGATLSAGIFRRLDRDFAARFSFLLSIPAILGALVLQGKDLLFPAADAAGAAPAAGIGLLPLVTGFLAAGVTGFFSINVTLKIVRSRSLVWFSLYTFLLGALILVDRLVTRLVF
ncbi:MAG: undecaprenyl-diphosphate phosphatase [Treponema sp.]|jgi:undecaprenyl-diphosphatase|nr:undecaprenyl-diphosphate phosphatase [Treponema sp.]